MKTARILVLIQLISAMRLFKRFLPITAQLPDFPTGQNSGNISNGPTVRVSEVGPNSA